MLYNVRIGNLLFLFLPALRSSEDYDVIFLLYSLV